MNVIYTSWVWFELKLHADHRIWLWIRELPFSSKPSNADCSVFVFIGVDKEGSAVNLGFIGFVSFLRWIVRRHKTPSLFVLNQPIRCATSASLLVWQHIGSLSWKGSYFIKLPLDQRRGSLSWHELSMLAGFFVDDCCCWMTLKGKGWFQKDIGNKKGLIRVLFLFSF